MTTHERVTDDPQRNAELVEGFETLGATDDAEWLVWDAESVVYPEDASAGEGAAPTA